jgi:phage terminase large subunit-like protein
VRSILDEPITLADVNQAIAIVQRRKIRQYYPDSGPLRRALYVKHGEFFASAARERLFMAANRVGKTEGVGAYEATLHLTGDYPDWWPGRRFNRPTRGWAAGDTSKTVREIIQHKLLGAPGSHGTGMIPGEALIRTTPKSGIPDAVDTIFVRHRSGGISTLVLKSYDQRRESFQGTEQDFIWLDEEPPSDIYFECVLRTMETSGFGGGMVMVTFTPINGWTDVVGMFLDEKQAAGRFHVIATWDDAPHLSEASKAELLASLPPHQRDARSKGIPSLGSGAIYPVPESEISCDPFEIPPHWPRAYGMDVGWNRTAAVWGALDRDGDTLYLYAEHYYAHSEPSENARAIRAKGEWIPGVIDPAARGRSQRDGGQLIQDYRNLGLDITTAINAREAGIYDVWTRLLSGKLKVFKSLPSWLGEYRQYRRDEKGQIVKEKDHLMDASRYLVMSGLDRAKVKPIVRSKLARAASAVWS